MASSKSLSASIVAAYASAVRVGILAPIERPAHFTVTDPCSQV
jgi:hypothetical protein